ncbi:exosome complex component CSL4 [Nematocida sp. LUAm3]|nr:exosome complex component CSL4 [Nematocida sp. LUAm3]KAI5175943.1 exosome complex component CSL4 [Nematocida sp. LUAm2]KAI5178675.1 exosome complex component CSL4 [Nematocida sp. LUAm1]
MILPGDPLYAAKLIFPEVNYIATAQVEYIQYMHVSLRMLQVNGVETLPVPAVIHREDAMYGIKDEDKLSTLFSPGDTVHARILSLGGEGPIVLSTSDDYHGVLSAMDFSTQKRLPIRNNQILHNGVPLKRKIAQHAPRHATQHGTR